ncbi:hypothetical protein OG909_31805 [Streptomyces sp. NBC_01754]|uniref:hypothetical protein n=1 Tax=Streptomyces sp. NBC_01754 TaxID=2975930 RepID=UPI002DD9FA69|nr:hypothetical protein [Streptomyces sp. NBC_01754]WSC96527.1 hypothetical protein OG909_31805 [Streptomyces sp. NBC_01754]
MEGTRTGRCTLFGSLEAGPDRYGIDIALTDADGALGALEETGMYVYGNKAPMLAREPAPSPGELETADLNNKSLEGARPGRSIWAGKGPGSTPGRTSACSIGDLRAAHGEVSGPPHRLYRGAAAYRADSIDAGQFLELGRRNG